MLGMDGTALFVSTRMARERNRFIAEMARPTLRSLDSLAEMWYACTTVHGRASPVQRITMPGSGMQNQSAPNPLESGRLVDQPSPESCSTAPYNRTVAVGNGSDVLRVALMGHDDFRGFVLRSRSDFAHSFDASR